MAELEVLKHTKKVFTVMKSDKSFWHKTKEIAIEIGIIVFAVSLSIWLHGKSELSHDRHDAKLFLLGLKTDLRNDIEEMKGDMAAYELVSEGFSYMNKVALGQPLNYDSLEMYKSIFYNLTLFNPNESRFEGLKSTGRLHIIENEKLLDNIVYFYQEDVAKLTTLNAMFTNYKTNNLFPALDRQLNTGNDGRGNWEEVLRSHEIRNATRRANFAGELVQQYQRTIKMAEQIIAGIENETEH